MESIYSFGTIECVLRINFKLHVPGGPEVTVITFNRRRGPKVNGQNFGGGVDKNT